MRARIVAALLGALAIVACTPTEVHEAQPPPVVPREGFLLPTAIGGQPLPDAFLGMVVTPDEIEAIAGPGRPPTRVVGAPFGLAEVGHGLIPALYDYLEAVDGSTEVVWLIDARVDMEVLASVLYTESRTGRSRSRLATGSITAPTMVELELFAFTGPGRDELPEAYVADLELHLNGSAVTTMATPRPVGDAPGYAALGAHYAPEATLVKLTADGSCRGSSVAALHDMGAALCKLDAGPYALGWVVDIGTPGRKVNESVCETSSA